MRIERVELHVGLDTFRPISTDDPLDHRMHSERYRVPPSTVDACATADRVIAVGTTSVRALESAASSGDLSGRTDLFIHRGFDWQVVDLTLTNFHLPRSSLLMLVAALAGRELTLTAYRHAIEKRYRFYSYGDAMMLTERA